MIKLLKNFSVIIPFWQEPRVVGPSRFEFRLVNLLHSNSPCLQWFYFGWFLSDFLVIFQTISHLLSEFDYASATSSGDTLEMLPSKKGLNLRRFSVRSPWKKGRKKATARAAAFIGLCYVHSPMRTFLVVLMSILSEVNLNWNVWNTEFMIRWKKKENICTKYEIKMNYIH